MLKLFTVRLLTVMKFKILTESCQYIEYIKKTCDPTLIREIMLSIVGMLAMKT